MTSLLTALALVFVAELGDKTQLVALGLGARYRLVPVLTGMALAYAVTNLISVVVGGLLGAALPTRAVGIGGGLLFLGFALWTLRNGDDEDDDDLAAVDPRRVVVSVAAAIFVAELGDKTMLATTTLAAAGDPALVWVGATIGIIAAGAVAVVVGRMVGARLPQRAVRLSSAVLFAVFGVVLVATSW
ncbi:MAG: TMEM165/GDT1 family protein [Acidimicrobiia bacterium]|nr:TMEM165/GDT1 family protein [Acidimicrobiia bacterium]